MPYKPLGINLNREYRNDLNGMLKELYDRVSNIVAQAGSDNTEIVDARLGVDGQARTTLGDFIRELQQDIIDLQENGGNQEEIDQLNTRVTAVENVLAETMQQIDINRIRISDLQAFVGYTDDDIVGVEVDFVNSKFTRLAGAVNRTPGAGFDDINAFGGRKRCILTDDGVVLAYYGEPGYVETGATTQEITVGATIYPVGTKVQVMVEQPKFYYKVVPLQLEPITDGIGYHLRKAKYYVSDTPKVGFKVHPAFVRNGVEVDKIYLSAYEGSIYDESAGTYLLADEQIADFNADKLSSIAYAKPASGLTQNLTRANTRKLANNRGNGWQQKDVLCISASQMLMMIEYAAFNMQSAIGLGIVNKPSSEGNESELTGATTNLGNASGMAVGTNGLVSISYRGEENFWGNIWKWIDGLNVYIDPDTRKTDAYWAAENFADDTGSAPYKHVGFNLAPNSGYVSAFGWSEECDFLFLPTETLGDSALPVGDIFNNTQTGWRVTLLGGGWSNGLNAGAFYCGVYYSSASHARSIGGRLLYVPQAEKVNKGELVVNVKDFGAIGDGVTDDTAFIQSVYDIVNNIGGGIVYFPKPEVRYKITSQINVYSNTKTVFSEGVIIDASSLLDGQKVFFSTGSLESPINLSVHALENTKTVSLVTASNLQSGDWVKISSNAVTGSTNQPKGEICKIKSINGNDITLYDPLCDDYLTTDGATVEKINFVENVTFEGSAIIVGSDDTNKGITGLDFVLCMNVNVNKMTFIKTHYCGVNFIDCINTSVEKCTFKDILKTGLAYGVAYSWACQDGVMNNCKGYRMRHLFTIGGGGSRKGVSRRITVSNCIATQMLDSGFDSHPGAEDISMINNQVLGSELDGFTMQARTFSMLGNKARNCSRHGILIQNTSVKPINGVVSNNVIERASGQGIAISLSDNYNKIDALNIINNNITKIGMHGIAQSTQLSQNVKNIKIEGNIINETGYHGIYCRNVEDSLINNNIVKNVNSTNENIYLSECKSMIINDNNARGGNRGVRLFTCSEINVCNNMLKEANVGILADNPTIYSLFANNNVRGCSTPLNLGSGEGNVSVNNIV